MKDLVVFDQLKTDITALVAPTLVIKVSSEQTGQNAITAVKQVKDYVNRVEELRKQLVGPLNEQVKAINAYAGEIKLPLARAEEYLKAELQRFHDEQEKNRAIELRKAEELRRAEEKAAYEKRCKEAEALRAKQAEEAAALKFEQEQANAAADIFGDDSSDQEEAAKTQALILEEKQKLEKEALEREQVAEQAARDNEAAQREWEINQNKIKGAAKTWKCEIENVALIPKDYLIITLNEKMVLAAARGGTTSIPGVKLWQETTIRVGASTRIPSITNGR